MNKIVYLDNNATTKIDEEVLEAMLPYFKENYMNPSSMYDGAQVCSKAIEEARGQVAELLGVENKKTIIFTSCATESANTAIRGVLAQNPDKKHIITSKVEHPCILSVYENLEKKGYKADYIDVNENGEINVDDILEKITPETALVSIMHANNETGAIYPVYEIASAVKKINKNFCRWSASSRKI